MPNPPTTPPTPTTSTNHPIAHWRCCLCHHTEHNAITRDLSHPASTTPSFHPARCALCAQPPCARCLVARPAPRWDAASRTYTSPSRLLEWNPARRDAWGFVCMHCGVPTLVSRARRFAHAAARTAWSRPTTTRDDECVVVLGPGATVSAEVAAGMVAAGMVAAAQGGRPYEGVEMEFLPFQRRRNVGVREMLGLVARCGNEACGQPMCDESLEFYVPVDGDGEDEEEVSRWEMADWICAAAEGTARWVSVAKLKRVAKGALGLGVIYYVLC